MKFSNVQDSDKSQIHTVHIVHTYATAAATAVRKGGMREKYGLVIARNEEFFLCFN